MKRLTFADIDKIEPKASATFHIIDPRARSNAQRLVYKWAEVNDQKVTVSVDRQKKTITVTRL